MVGELLELLEWLVASLAGWRYLLSPTYRRRVHEDWRDEKWYYIAWDVLCGTAGIVFSALILFGVFQLLSYVLGR